MSHLRPFFNLFIRSSWIKSAEKGGGEGWKDAAVCCVNEELRWEEEKIHLLWTSLRDWRGLTSGNRKRTEQDNTGNHQSPFCQCLSTVRERNVFETIYISYMWQQQIFLGFYQGLTLEMIWKIYCRALDLSFDSDLHVILQLSCINHIKFQDNNKKKKKKSIGENFGIFI